ncbi:putative uncharacterized protein DDB_G0271982 [Hydractinia symbiolongicarpus]|uniref:putative uncharacterized protein DDB_G0271982 n=1 Tax=Hydractinia symbiolongicarpus TaxID=13093 RepID=UPI00254D5BF6|nr:putative uncharacterized protein DDB_G0271982 [Hydractinia symbiolongicarpus]XP_057293325.1 putative uncharacterized protein DDB_G0271982 [Hydractinia symbiolongicarpus]
MKIWIYVATIIAASQLFVLVTCENDDEEPHSYTISFFQFDPKALGVGDDVKKESKKDIKPSDANLMQQLSNNTVTDVSNNTVTDVSNKTVTDVSNNTVTDVNNNTVIDVSNKAARRNATTEYKESHKHFNDTDENTEKGKQHKTENKNTDYTEYKKNGTETENKKITGPESKMEDKSSAKNVSIPTAVNNATMTQNKTSGDKRSRVKHTSKKHAIQNVKQTALKKDVLNPNPRPSQSEAEMNLHVPQYQGTPTEKETNVKVDKNVPLFQANNTVAEKNNNTASVKDNTVTLKKTGDSQNPEVEVDKNNSSGDGKEEEKKVEKEKISNQTKESGNEKEKEENKGMKSEEEKELAKDTQTVEVKKMEEKKTKNLKNSTKENAQPASAKNDTQTAKEEEAQRLAKLEKDKKINKEIKENAKKIHDVKDTVANDTVSKKANNTVVKGIKKEKLGKGRHNTNVMKPAGMTYTDEDDDADAKDRVARHRELVSHFVPTYNVNPKDHGLGFQLGSLKHPKHDIYPQCHHCRRNSTYSQCVRRSTLKSCKNGLNNICFSKSVKKHGVVTYQMGCADHKRCSTARAFPCKDGSRDCFTCCQFDRCNSSPHHGDYELDELNMDELTLDTSLASNVKPDWFYHFCVILVNVLVLRVVL